MSERDLSELLSRVDGATGPDREIEEQIAFALGLIPTGKEWKKTGDATWHKNLRLDWNGSRFDECFQPGAYTASIDAAVGLVEKMLQDCSWNIEREHYYDKGVIRYRYIARLRAAGSPRLHVVATLSTPALALIAALLKAMISQSNPERPGVE